MLKTQPVLYRPQLSKAFEGVWVAVTQTGFAEQDEGYGINYGTHVGEPLDDVHARRRALELEAGAPIVWLNQLHGVDVCEANPEIAQTSWVNAPSADASMALDGSVTLSIMTADCLPAVYVSQNAAGVPVGVAAAHAGWKGLLNGVLENTALRLAEATTQPLSRISVWLGPAIGPQSFEVGAEVRQAFCKRFPDHAHHAFESGANSGKYLADIYSLAKMSLNSIGIERVEGANPPEDTFKDLNWFSHRRSGLLGRQAGRMVTLVRLLPR